MRLTSDGELKLYRSLAQLLGETLDIHQLASGAAALVTEAVAANVCFVHLVDYESSHLSLVGATPPFDQLRDRIQLGLGDGIAGWVAQTGEVAIVPDKWHDHRYRYIPELQGERFSALVSVPLAPANGKVVGVLNVHWEMAQEDLQGSADLLATVAHFLTGAFANALLLDRISSHEGYLRSFAEQLLEAQESERRRMLLDLHDGVLQQLHAAVYRLDALRIRVEEDSPAWTEIAAVRALVQDSAVEVRRVVEDPGRQVLEDFGLVEAVSSLASSFPEFEVRLDIQVRNEDLELSPAASLAAFRICQEAVNNARKHSGADSCELRMAIIAGELVIVIRDRGCGFDAGDAGFTPGIGLAGMRERSRIFGGRFEVFSRPEEGTLVRAVVPVGALPNG